MKTATALYYFNPTANTSASDSVTFKISLPSRHGRAHDEIRRMTFSYDELGLDTLRHRCRQLFDVPEGFCFKWTDDDGDEVTLSEEAELIDLVRLSAHRLVINLVVQQPEVPAALDRRPLAAHEIFGMFDPFVNLRTSPMPAPLRTTLRTNLFPQPEPELPAPAAALLRSIFLDPSRSPAPSTIFPDPSRVYAAMCDATGVPLRMGQNWYHLEHSNIDIDDKVYRAMEPAMREGFLRVNKPEDLGQDEPRYRTMWPRECSRRCPPPSATPKDTAGTKPEDGRTEPSKNLPVVSDEPLKEETIEEIQCDDERIFESILEEAEKVAGQSANLVARSGSSESSDTDLDDESFVEVDHAAASVEHSNQHSTPIAASTGDGQLVEDEDEVEDKLEAAVRLLVDAGLGDASGCRAAIHRAAGDVDVAAIALLRR